jgi:sodium pump decarboxylase gamma subunit
MMGPDLTFGIQITITGLVVVFTALVSVGIIVTLFQRINQPKSETKTSAPAPAARTAAPSEQAAATPEASNGSMSPEVAAAIAAAVTISLRKKVRIHRVQYRSGPLETAWSRQGRYAIMTSHQPKHK